MSAPCPDPPLDAPPSGYTEAIEALYDQFGRRLYRTAWGMLGRQEDAEDAVQEVFVALVRYQVKRKRTPAPWHLVSSRTEIVV
jgi:DNA-directed RNA polymerase specialized sigma24 family protein